MGATILTESDSDKHDHLVPGSLWRTTAPLSPWTSRAVVLDPHPFAYLDNAWIDTSATFPVGTFGIYAGTVRLTESSGGKNYSVTRPSFIIGGVRYITSNLTHYEPVHESVAL